MALKNYTTAISVEKTISEIQGKLAYVGARRIMSEYDDSGTVIAGKFTKKLQSGWRWGVETSAMILIKPDDGTQPVEISPKSCYRVREEGAAPEEEK